MFVVCKMQKFEFEANPPFPFPIEIDKGKMIGYLPVYESSEDALEEFPGSNLIRIEKLDKERRDKW